MNIHNEIDKRLLENDRVIIAIDGPSGSGKSTLGEQLRQKYNCPIIHVDDYFLPSIMKSIDRLEKPGNNFHIERMIEEVYSKLEDDVLVTRRFDCEIQELLEPTKTEISNLLIVEGAYSMHPDLVKFYTLKIFLNVSKENQIDRIQKRSGDKMLSKWINEWIPLEDDYFNKFSVSKNADFNITL